MPNNDYKYIWEKYIQGRRYFGKSRIFSDKDPGDILGEELEKREVLYTKLLRDYSNITNKRNAWKEVHKWIFFWIIIAAGIVTSLFCYKVMHRILKIDDSEQFVKAFPVIATVFISFLSTIVGIPLTVSKFLFNSKEDENITNTIHHTQEHDFEEVKLLKERYTSYKRKENKEASGKEK